MAEIRTDGRSASVSRRDGCAAELHAPGRLLPTDHCTKQCCESSVFDSNSAINKLSIAVDVVFGGGCAGSPERERAA